MTHEIRIVAKYTPGESRGFGFRGKNLDGGTKIFRVKLKSKENVSKISLGVKKSKLKKL